MDPKEFSKWSGYELIEEIGSGSYSTVWKAVHISSGKTVAIKEETQLFSELEDCKRIVREIILLREIKHPNIISLFDVFVDGSEKKFDTLYLVLELADASLRDLIKSPIYLKEGQIKALLYNMLIGLKYLESAGVLHRDLTPGNILIYEDCSAKICDFGLSRTAVEISCPLLHRRMKRKKEAKAKEEKKDAKLALYSMTKPEEEKSSTLPKSEKIGLTIKRKLSSHVVTRWYRAPEVVLVQRDYGHQIDVWAAGCIFAELQGTIKENLSNYEHRTPLFPGQCCTTLSPTFAKIDDSKDQLNVIISVIGSPTEKDLSFIESKEIIDKLLSLPKTKPIDLAAKFPHTNPLAIHLIEKMLSFNPYTRYTIDECLAHPYLATIRNKTKEYLAPAHVKMPFEDGAHLSEPELRAIISSEVSYYAKLRKEGKLMG